MFRVQASCFRVHGLAFLFFRCSGLGLRFAAEGFTIHTLGLF